MTERPRSLPDAEGHPRSSVRRLVGPPTLRFAVLEAFLSACEPERARPEAPTARDLLRTLDPGLVRITITDDHEVSGMGG